MKFSSILVATGSLSVASAASLPYNDPNSRGLGSSGGHLQSILGAASKWLGIATINAQDATLKEMDALLGNELDEFGSRVNRLLDTGFTKLISKSEMDKMDMLSRGEKFMDITDHYEFYDELERQQIGAPEVATFPLNVSHSSEVHKLLPLINQTTLYSNLNNYSSFHTRYYRSQTGLEASLWLFSQIEAVAKANPNITVYPFSHPWSQKSVIARIPGKNSKGDKNHPVVIISAHLDSTNLLLPSILPAPGADDDGSGTVTILEAFRVLVEFGYEPDNTLEFHWYSAEEGGLLGSQSVLTEYKKRNINVKAQLQQDMTGYVPDKADEKFGVITDYVSRELTTFVEVVIDAYTNLPYAEDKCGYACSDHASGTKVGFPSAFVIESLMDESNPYIHTTKDTIDRLDFAHMEQHVRLTLGFAYELGKYEFK